MPQASAGVTIKVSTHATSQDILPQFQIIDQLGAEDTKVLVEKDASYGSSWRKRGGIGAFMMLARKWDRLERMLALNGYDIFKLIEDHNIAMAPDDDNHVLAQIRDLRRYLFLVDSWMILQSQSKDGNPYTSHEMQRLEKLHQDCEKSDREAQLSPPENPEPQGSLAVQCRDGNEAYILSHCLKMIREGNRITYTKDGDWSELKRVRRKRNAFSHKLYKKGDPNIPAAILDTNGDVALGLCKVCGAAESELDETRCSSSPENKAEHPAGEYED